MTAARVTVPTGTVPDLRDFMKHVWRYRDEHGHTALVAPPEVFTLVIDDAGDRDIAVSAVSLLCGPLGFAERAAARFVNGNTHIAFCDLQVLHAFLQVLSMRSDQQEPRELAAFVLESLGFRWT